MPISRPPIRGIRYRNPTWPGLPLEAVSMRDLWGRGPESQFRRPGRPGFHHLFLCTAGRGLHTVDFQRFDLLPGTVLHVRPGQVHAFGWNRGVDGVALLFAPEALPSGLGVEPPPCLRLEGAARAALERAFRDLLDEYGRTDGGPLSTRILRHLLAALVLRLVRLAADPEPDAASGRRALFRLFEEDVERRFLQTRIVADYARYLGYAERTLVRAAWEAAGTSPKAFIAARVLLEAKRLLAHTDWTIGRVAVHLGFSEPTNFAKFFRRGAGLSPEAFRLQES